MNLRSTTSRFAAIAFTSLLLMSTSQAFAQDVKTITDPAQMHSREPLRKKIFGDAADKPGCKSIRTLPAGALASLDAELDSFIKMIETAIEAKNPKGLVPLFHRRLNIGVPALHQAITQMDNVYRSPFDVSVYRLWALNTVDGSPDSIKCEEDNVTINPQYGYPLQFVAWMQVLGQNELGRIYLNLVPTKSRWNIGAYHSQQWTHAGLDYAAWVDKAQKQGRMGFKEVAFINYDIAAKLTNAGRFMKLHVEDDIAAARDAIMTLDQWKAKVKPTFKLEPPAYFATMLAQGGAGILLRIPVPKEISARDTQTRCTAQAEQLFKEQLWARRLAGIRCSFMLPREDPRKEGALGGPYISFDQFRQEEGN